MLHHQDNILRMSQVCILYVWIQQRDCAFPINMTDNLEEEKMWTTEIAERGY